MLIIIISRSSLKLGHVGSKTTLLGQQATQVSEFGPLCPSCFLDLAETSMSEMSLAETSMAELS